MRERLRLILSKKKQQNKRKLHQQQQQQQHHHHQQQQHQTRTPSASSTASSSATNNTNSQVSSSCCAATAHKPSAATATSSKSVVNLTAETDHAKSQHSQQQQPKDLKKHQQQQAPQRSASGVVSQKTNNTISKSASQPQVQQQPPLEDKGLDELLDFIEGNAKSANEKKRAKKERQKQQRLEEIRKREAEERRQREAAEAERKRREHEEKKRAEEERLAEKKRKKKEAQKLKKMAAKGLQIPQQQQDQHHQQVASDKTAASSKDPEAVLEELKARHMRELKELQLQQQRQLEQLFEHSKAKVGGQQPLQQAAPQGGSVRLTAQTPQMMMSGTVSNSNASSKPIKRNEALQSKPGTQIKITRTPSGGVEFTTVPASASGGGQPQSQPQQQPPMASSFMAEGLCPQFPPQMVPPGAFGRPEMTMPPEQQQQQPVSFGGGVGSEGQNGGQRPHVPSKSGAPMVTIRRIENAGEPTVTISMAKDSNHANKKSQSSNGGTGGELLYTLVNGQALRTPEAPSDLIPHAKLMESGSGSNLSKSKKKRLRKQGKSLDETESPMPSPKLPQRSPAPNFTITGPSGATIQPTPISPSSSAGLGMSKMAPQRPALPLDGQGKVDLERLQLPPGISITRIQGEAPERKYFPVAPSDYSGRDQSVLPLPGSLEPEPPIPAVVVERQQQQSPQQPHLMASNSSTPLGVTGNVDYKAMEGMPAGLNGPNVIVVDTSSLKTKEEEEKESIVANANSVSNNVNAASTMTKPTKTNKKKNKKNNQNKQQQAQESGDNISKSASVSGFPPSYMQPDVPPVPAGGNNSLKSGPQVLIKNVNGKVTFTPVPGTGATPVNPADLKVSNKINQNGGQQQKNATTKSQQQQHQVKQQPKPSNPSPAAAAASNPQLKHLNEAAVQKSHSVPNVNGHVHQDHHHQQPNMTNGGSSNEDSRNKRNNRKDRRKSSFSSHDGDDPGEDYFIVKLFFLKKYFVKSHWPQAKSVDRYTIIQLSGKSKQTHFVWAVGGKK